MSLHLLDSAPVVPSVALSYVFAVPIGTSLGPTEAAALDRLTTLHSYITKTPAHHRRAFRKSLAILQYLTYAPKPRQIRSYNFAMHDKHVYT